MKWLFIANAFNAACSMCVLWVLAHILSPAKYTEVAYIIYFSNMLACACDWGISLALVKVYHANDRSNTVLGSAFIIRSVALLLTIISALLLPSNAIELLGFSNEQVPIGRAAIIFSGFIAFWMLGKSFFQAQDKWLKMSAFVALYGVLRVIGIVFCANEKSTSLQIGCYTLGFPALICTVIMIYIWANLKIKSDNYLTKPSCVTGIKLILSYTKWVGFGNLAFQAQMMMSIWYANKYLSVSESGKLMLASSFSGPLAIMVSSLRVGLVSRASKIKTSNDWGLYIQKAKQSALLLASISIIVIIFCSGASSIAYGDKFPNIAMLVVAASIGVIAPGIIGYFSVLIHTVNRPSDEAILHFMRLFIMAGVFAFIKPELSIVCVSIQVVISITIEVIQSVRAFKKSTI